MIISVIKLYPHGFASNSYLITADNKRAIVIDPAQPRILDVVEQYGLRVQAALLTHGHFDHIGGCAALQRTGAEIACLAEERELLLGRNNLAEDYGVEIEPFTLDFTVKDGDSLMIAGMEIEVIATPGHTAGGACYRIAGNLFTGDTLFAGSVGRTDLPTGDGASLERSVRKLYALDGDFTLYTGHGEDSRLSYERENNGYIRA